MAVKSTKWPYNIPTLQDPPKFTQIGIFGLKIFHLATLKAPDNYNKLFPLE
jgi:hypothetical protein